MSNVILYFVVSTHDGTPTCAVAGPFINEDLAYEWRDANETEGVERIVCSVNIGGIEF